MGQKWVRPCSHIYSCASYIKINTFKIRLTVGSKIRRHYDIITWHNLELLKQCLYCYRDTSQEWSFSPMAKISVALIYGTHPVMTLTSNCSAIGTSSLRNNTSWHCSTALVSDWKCFDLIGWSVRFPNSQRRSYLRYLRCSCAHL